MNQTIKKKPGRDLQKAVFDWYCSLRSTNNDTFLPLFFDKHRFLVLMGGGGSGKSIFAGRKILERCTTEPNHRFLVVRKVGKTLFDSCYDQLKTQANTFYKAKIKAITRSPMNIEFNNGSKILFSGLDDVEKLKSIHHITGIWIEEASEIAEGDLNQLDIRLRDKTPYYKQIIISFNPVSVTHWLKKRFFDRSDPRAYVHRSTYKDNRFLPPESVQTLEGFRETDEYFYMVYALGMWGVTGKTVFNAQKVAERLEHIPKPIAQGFFTFSGSWDDRTVFDIKFIPDDRNPLVKIYRSPEKNRPYVLGCDTAGEGSDRFSADMLDNASGVQVARILMTTGETEFTQQAYCLGLMYNQALIAIESNFSTYPNKELFRIGYPKLYFREGIDTYTKKPKKTFGFRTDKLSRNTIIAGLINYTNDKIDCINDRDTLEEMLTFVRNEQFRPEAQEGAHDDCVMSYAIALYCGAEQQSTQEPAPEKPRVKWTEDMWEDYRGADKETRNMLLAEWGTPER